jgi:RNA polymerase sigma factor (sigma-70 family)
MDSATIEAFLPLSRRIAADIWKHHGRALELDDLKGEASLILVKAANSYDPSRGRLSAHIAARVQFDLTDYIRSANPLTRNHQESIKRGESRRIKHIPLTFEKDGRETLRSMLSKDDGAIEASLAAEDLERLLRSVKFTLLQGKVFVRIRAGKASVEIAKELGLRSGHVRQLRQAVIEKLRNATANPAPIFLGIKKSTLRTRSLPA